jgi:hypothetical protein
MNVLAGGWSDFARRGLWRGRQVNGVRRRPVVRGDHCLLRHARVGCGRFERGDCDRYLAGRIRGGVCPARGDPVTASEQPAANPARALRTRDDRGQAPVGHAAAVAAVDGLCPDVTRHRIPRRCVHPPHPQTLFASR